MEATHFAYSLEICALHGLEHLAVERRRHGGSEQRPVAGSGEEIGQELRGRRRMRTVHVVVSAQFNDRPNNAQTTRTRPSHDRRSSAQTSGSRVTPCFDLLALTSCEWTIDSCTCVHCGPCTEALRQPPMRTRRIAPSARVAEWEVPAPR